MLPEKISHCGRHRRKIANFTTLACAMAAAFAGFVGEARAQSMDYTCAAGAVRRARHDVRHRIAAARQRCAGQHDHRAAG